MLTILYTMLLIIMPLGGGLEVASTGMFKFTLLMLPVIIGIDIYRAKH